MTERRRILLTEAAKRLGISITTIRRLVSDGQLKTYDNPLDKRQKLVDEAAVEALAALRPHRQEVEPKKVAA